MLDDNLNGQISNGRVTKTAAEAAPQRTSKKSEALRAVDQTDAAEHSWAEQTIHLKAKNGRH